MFYFLLLRHYNRPTIFILLLQLKGDGEGVEEKLERNQLLDACICILLKLTIGAVQYQEVLSLTTKTMAVWLLPSLPGNISDIWSRTLNLRKYAALRDPTLLVIKSAAVISSIYTPLLSNDTEYDKVGIVPGCNTLYNPSILVDFCFHFYCC